MRHLKIAVTGLLILPMLLFAQSAPEPPTLRVLSSNGVRAPLEDARADLEAALGYTLDIEFSTSAELTRRIQAGESFDVAILTPALVDGLVDAGSVAARPRPTFARVGVGVGARIGEIAASIATVEEFKAVLLDADSIAFTAEGQSRRTTEAAFDALGISDAMLGKARIVGPGEAPALVAGGDAELLLTLVSEILPVPGLELVGPYPDEVQGYVSFAASIGRRSKDEAGSRRLVEQLAGAGMSNTLRAGGMEPVGP